MRHPRHELARWRTTRLLAGFDGPSQGLSRWLEQDRSPTRDQEENFALPTRRHQEAWAYRTGFDYTHVHRWPLDQSTVKRKGLIKLGLGWFGGVIIADLTRFLGRSTTTAPSFTLKEARVA